MRAWTKWLGLAAFGLVATNAVAADHGDGPAVSAAAATDITDVYAWVSDDNAKLILIMNVAGEFSPGHLYVFHIGRTSDRDGAIQQAASDTTEVICQFASTTSVQCWGGGEYVTGDPSPNGGITTMSGDLAVHAAEHADPFFMYLTGLLDARQHLDSLVKGNQLTLDANGCPDTSVVHPSAGTNGLPTGFPVANVLAAMLNGSRDANLMPSTPSNEFATRDVWSIVIEIDKDIIAGSGEFFQVWASTNIPG